MRIRRPVDKCLNSPAALLMVILKANNVSRDHISLSLSLSHS
jgi:hypothetical protein